MDMEYKHYLIHRPDDSHNFELWSIVSTPFEKGRLYDYFSENITLFQSKSKWRSVAFFNKEHIIKGSNNLEELKELAYMEML